MSDTIQGVQWCLEYACPFRQDDAVLSPAAASAATWRLRAIDDAHRRGDVYGDVCVTSQSFSRDGTAPGGGFRVSAATAAAGGLAAAREVCRACPANAFGPVRGMMAGCCGFLHSFEPPDLDIALASASHDVSAAFARTFVVTRPLWWGLWISSPMSREQVSVLSALLSRFPPREDGEGDLRPFTEACRIAAGRDIPLHVALAPPGHIDFGFRTVFAHCPRCKMGSGHEWERKGEDWLRPLVCKACGFTYVPADTASSERSEDRDRDALESQMSPEEYQAFLQIWLGKHASDPDPVRQLFERMKRNDRRP